MVSDFIDEVSSFVRTDTEEARFLLETSYFNNDHLLDQVEHTIDIFEKIDQDATGLFLFDDGLNVEKNVNPGGTIIGVSVKLQASLNKREGCVREGESHKWWCHWHTQTDHQHLNHKPVLRSTIK